MTSVDFKQQLGRQLAFIRNSCERYDSGDHDEGIRIAVSMRVLFHETRTQTSLLSHLNATDIALLSTCPDRPLQSEQAEDGLEWFDLSFEMAPITIAGGRVSVEPELDQARHRKFLSASRWWNQTVFVVPPGNLQITRRSLALAAADKDGGAHVDSELAPDYQSVIDSLRFNASVVTPTGTELVSLENSHLVALRQMGYELLNSPELTEMAESRNERP